MYLNRYLVTNLSLCGYLEQDDTSRHVLVLGHPVAQIVVGGRPLKVHDVRYLDAFLVEQRERLRFVDKQRIGAQTRKILVVEIPLEIRPHECHRSLARERTLLLTRAHAPDNERLIVDARFVRVARDQVVLARREVNQLHAVMSESRKLIELFASPQSDASVVERRKVGAFRRPLESRLGPFLIIKIISCKINKVFQKNKNWGHTSLDLRIVD